MLYKMVHEIGKRFSIHHAIWALEELQVEADSATISKAMSLSYSMRQFGFLVALTTIHRLLNFTVALCEYRQAEDCDLVRALRQTENVISQLKKERKSEECDIGVSVP
jgi:hypothetical protein